MKHCKKKIENYVGRRMDAGLMSPQLGWVGVWPWQSRERVWDKKKNRIYWVKRGKIGVWSKLGEWKVSLSMA